MYSARHKDGFAVLVVEEKDDKARCEFFLDGVPRTEWLNINDISKVERPEMNRINIIKTGHLDQHCYTSYYLYNFRPYYIIRTFIRAFKKELTFLSFLKKS